MQTKGQAQARIDPWRNIYPAVNPDVIVLEPGVPAVDYSKYSPRDDWLDAEADTQDTALDTEDLDTKESPWNIDSEDISGSVSRDTSPEPDTQTERTFTHTARLAAIASAAEYSEVESLQAEAIPAVDPNLNTSPSEIESLTFYQAFRAGYPNLAVRSSKRTTVLTTTVTREVVDTTTTVEPPRLPASLDWAKFRIPAKSKNYIGLAETYSLNFSRKPMEQPRPRKMPGKPLDIVERERKIASRAHSNSNSLAAITSLFSDVLTERDSAFAVCEEISAERV